MKNTEFENVEKYVAKIAEHKLIFAKEMYNQKFSNMNLATFLKYLSRLVKKNILLPLGKGVYCRPRVTPFGLVGLSEMEIKNFFVEDGRGIEVGYGLYNKYGLTTQVSKRTIIYSTKALYDLQNIGNLQIQRLHSKRRIECLFEFEYMEILENFNSIQDIDIQAFFEFCKKIAAGFNEKKLLKVFELGKYKKRTIAFLVNILDFFHCQHSLRCFLNATSRYNFLRMEDLYGAVG